MRRQPQQVVRRTLLVVLLVVVAALAQGCDGRPAAGDDEPLTGPYVVELDLSRGLPEVPPGGFFGAPVGRTHADLVDALSVLGDDHKGVFVRLGGASTSMAQAQEIGRLLATQREADVPVYCHAYGYDNASLLLAARGCSKIWVSEAGGVSAVGIAAQLVFAKNLFERVGVDADFIQVGRFKGAKEPFTRESASPEHRQSVQGLLSGQRKAWIDRVGEGRGNDKLSGALEDGPYTASRAKKLGLIDELGSADQALAALKDEAGVKRVESLAGFGRGDDGGPEGLSELLRVLSGAGDAGSPRVAVVTAAGSIAMTSSVSLLGGSSGITYSDLGDTLEDLEDDPDVAAVVLRIDSPGGSALASDLIWQRMMSLRKEKPVVVSIGRMAASGGYYIACAGSHIVAEETSMIGSIGVVVGKFSIGSALEQIGVSSEIVAANPERAQRAAYGSPLAEWDDKTRDRVVESAKDTYDRFVERVMEGRDQSKEKVGAYAEGRMFAGVRAHELGMVDELGGLAMAIAKARELASLPDDAPAVLVVDPGGLAELLAGPEARTRGEVADERLREMSALSFDKTLPIEVQQLLGSLGPLIDRDRAPYDSSLALPFALIVN